MPAGPMLPSSLTLAMRPSVTIKRSLQFLSRFAETVVSTQPSAR